MATVTQTARKVHRFLSYLIFAQLTLWILGGLTFAVVPFESVVKGGAVLAAPETPDFPDGWIGQIPPHVAALGNVDGIAAHDSSQGLLMELRSGDKSRWVRLSDGAAAAVPLAAEVASYAEHLYRGEGRGSDTRHIRETEYRYWGLVDELYGGSDVWRVSFDDAYDTRLYFDGPTGRYLTVRNDFWVFYDAMWRLHIMDYAGGENFNNIWLRVLTPLAAFFAISGLFLTWSAASRAMARRR
jgi:hypothetical protein